MTFPVVVGVKRREETATVVSQQTVDHNSAPKKPRLVFTDLQRRTLQAIFKVCSLHDFEYSRNLLEHTRKTGLAEFLTKGF